MLFQLILIVPSLTAQTLPGSKANTIYFIFLLQQHLMSGTNYCFQCPPLHTKLLQTFLGFKQQQPFQILYLGIAQQRCLASVPHGVSCQKSSVSAISKRASFSLVPKLAQLKWLVELLAFLCTFISFRASFFSQLLDLFTRCLITQRQE